jgi:hypothetical protein
MKLPNKISIRNLKSTCVFVGSVKTTTIIIIIITIIIIIITAIEQSPLDEAVSLSAREGLRLLWNKKVYYRIHNSPLLDPTQSQSNPLKPMMFMLMGRDYVSELRPLAGLSFIPQMIYEH